MNREMKKSVYATPECKIYALAQELLFSTSGEQPVTPGINNSEDNSDERNVHIFNTKSEIWDE